MKKKSKQEELPGMESRDLREIEQAAEHYQEIRDERCELSKREAEAKSALMQVMKNKGRTFYSYNGLTVELATTENVKVKSSEGDDDEPAGTFRQPGRKREADEQIEQQEAEATWDELIEQQQAESEEEAALERLTAEALYEIGAEGEARRGESPGLINTSLAGDFIDESDAHTDSLIAAAEEWGEESAREMNPWPYQGDEDGEPEPIGDAKLYTSHRGRPDDFTASRCDECSRIDGAHTKECSKSNELRFEDYEAYSRAHYKSNHRSHARKMQLSKVSDEKVREWKQQADNGVETVSTEGSPNPSLLCWCKHKYADHATGQFCKKKTCGCNLFSWAGEAKPKQSAVEDAIDR